MKRFKPTPSKFVRASDLISLAEENNFELVKLLTNTLGEGYYSTTDIQDLLDLSLLTVGEDLYLNLSLTSSGVFGFLDSSGFVEHKQDELTSYSVLFDEYNAVNGSITNPISVPPSLFKLEQVDDYSSSYFSFLYVNGTPQLSGDISINATSEDIKISLSRVRGGYIYPLPKDKHGIFNHKIVTGISWSEFRRDFCDENLNCYLDFGFLNIPTTTRYLMLKVISAGQEISYHVPKNIPVYDKKIYYYPSSDSPSVAVLSLEDLSLNDGDVLSVFFIEEILPSFSPTREDLFVNQYKLKGSNYLPETAFGSVVYVLDEQSGKFINLSNLNNLLVTNVYTINTSTGTVSVNSSYLPTPQSRLFIANYFYAPPLRFYPESDYLNNLTLYGPIGASFKVSTWPSTIYLYVRNMGIPSRGITYYDSRSKVVSAPNTYDLRTHFFLSPNQVDLPNYMYAGTVNISIFRNLSFTPSSLFLTPYSRLVELAREIHIPQQWSSTSLYKLSLQSSSYNYISIPILPIITINGKVTAIKAISVKLKVYAIDNNVTSHIPFTMSIVPIDGTTQIGSNLTFGNNLSTSDNDTYQFGTNNLFTSQDLYSITFQSSTHRNPVFYLFITSNRTNFFVDIDYIIIHYQIR